MSIGIPIKLLHEAEGHVVTVELKTGEVYRGRLLEAEDNMNCKMNEITLTARDGSKHPLEHAFIRGSHIRFLILPDILKNAPMFRKDLAKALKAKGLATAVAKGNTGGGRGGRGGGRGRANIYQQRQPAKHSEITLRDPPLRGQRDKDLLGQHQQIFSNTRKMKKTSSVQQVSTGGASVHSFSQEEKEAFCDHINDSLGKEEQLSALLPVNSEDNSLFEKCKDGKLLWCVP